MEYGYNLNSFVRNVRKDGLASALAEDGKQTLYHLKETSVSFLGDMKRSILFGIAVGIATPITIYEIYKSHKLRDKNETQN